MSSDWRRKFRFGIGLCILIAATACSSTRKAVREPIKEQGETFLIEQLKHHELEFQSFSAHFNATYSTGPDETSVSGTLRIHHDSIIWISITPALRLEAIRLELTPDSIKYLNRLNTTYLIKDFSYISQLINKSLDYDMAQAFLLGNDFSLYETNKFRASIDNMQYKLSTTDRRKIRRTVRRNNDNISIPIQWIWLDPENFKISKVLLKEAERDSRKFLATYSEFENINNQLIPTRMEFNAETEAETVSIVINYSKIQIDQDLTFPFRIPDSYNEIKELHFKKKR